MAFPEAPRVIFDRNPLAEVICQLRFPPILAITAEPPSAFQEKVRHIYSLYERNDGAPAWPKEAAAILAQFHIQFPGESVTHRFSTDDSKRYISLAQGFVSISESSYIRWEEFESQVNLAVQATEDVYRPRFYTRVGLRYQNVIDKEKLGLGSKDWDELISKPLLGLLGAQEIKNDATEMRSETLIRLSAVSGGFVRIRCGLAGIPPEEPKRRSYIVDSDFFTEERSTHGQAFSALAIFNRISRNLFQWAITQELVQVLGPRPID